MKRKKYTSLSEINVTNLVDVTIVLLIIFMISAPLLRSGIEVDLPKAKAETQKLREGILITYTRDGWIYIDSDRFQQNDFEDRLTEEWKKRGHTQVSLSADREIPYGRVVNLVDRIRAVGITNLGLVLQPVLEEE
jgi:biopolymer transport protein TolR